MAKVLVKVACQTCANVAEIRSRGGARTALDMNCEHCGVLSYQTRSGQAMLKAMVDAAKAPEELPILGTCEQIESTGNPPEKKPLKTGFTTLMDAD